MARYRKKPVDVEMICWLGPIEPIEHWIDELMARGETVPSGGDFQGAAEPGKLRFHCAASQAQVTIEVGDWIAIERDGRGFYPISRADQADSYEDPSAIPVVIEVTSMPPEQVFTDLQKFLTGTSVLDVEPVIAWARDHELF